MPSAPRPRQYRAVVVRVLGIDPGSRITGYGIVDAQGNRLAHVASGCISLGSGPMVERLSQIYRQINALIVEFAPHEVAIEQVFMHRNPQSALKLGQARGAAIVGASSEGTPVFEYSATQIKQATTGRGHAAKEQVQHMIRVLLNLDATPPSDAADALAAAVAHSHYRETAARVTSADGVMAAGVANPLALTRSRRRTGRGGRR